MEVNDLTKNTEGVESSEIQKGDLGEVDIGKGFTAERVGSASVKELLNGTLTLADGKRQVEGILFRTSSKNVYTLFPDEDVSENTVEVTKENDYALFPEKKGKNIIRVVNSRDHKSYTFDRESVNVLNSSVSLGEQFTFYHGQSENWRRVHTSKVEEIVIFCKEKEKKNPESSILIDFNKLIRTE